MANAPLLPAPGGHPPDSTPSVARLAYTLAESAQALGVSLDYFDEHICHELRVVRRGRKVLVPVEELQARLRRKARQALADE